MVLPPSAPGSLGLKTWPGHFRPLEPLEWGPREFLMSFLHHIFFCFASTHRCHQFHLTKPDPRSRCASPVFAVVVSSIWTARARPQSARLWSLEPLKVILLEYINNIDLYIIYCIPTKPESQEFLQLFQNRTIFLDSRNSPVVSGDSCNSQKFLQFSGCIRWSFF